MSDPGIIAIDDTQAARVLDIMTLAFARDPVARFWWSQPDQYLYWWPRWVMAIGRNGFGHGGVDALADFSAAAIWLPPGIQTDPADIAALDMPGGDPEEEALGNALQAEMARYHPQEDHWYLWTLGTDPAFQGKGLGGQLLEHRLDVADDAGIPAYLEASSPGLVPFYSRYGFEQVGLIEVSPVPPLVPMYRKPR
ncbi:puromycin N-acetyltransferase, putative [Altererythrobacter epoxidivorans]|uniref:Puromycin N-acetyltransferase, putative n=1 Tax=Altererythrobacter epoxidivorans TaxID=361183 RepID=A0A0M4M339_9SPHN|nr:GNAT family N-acetyltransferase [Altererythrobacter epoxidivorans]ALE15953.1 puromycin N-acetyltransferase, putative [Altererythrobacter epoxidivorans]